MTEPKPARRHPSCGRRYSPAEKAQILKDADDVGVIEAAKKHACSAWSIYEWRKKQARTAVYRPPAEAEGDSSARGLAAEDGQPVYRPPAEAEAEGDSSARGLAAEDGQPADPRESLILDLWRQQPGLGPSQIRNQLKRRGLKASVNTVRTIMEEHGYVQPRIRRREHTGRYEAVRPLQLVHLDFCHFHVHRQKQCLLLMADDCSRFIPGWKLLKSEHAAGACEALETAINRYGKFEAVMSDRGAAFHSWNGLSQFERLLEEYGIDHYLAKEPQVNGKAEALVATVKKELIRQVEFTDLADAYRQIASWVRFYNYQRTHHGLGGLLVPADRFHGWQEETLKRIEQGHSADYQDMLNPDVRGLDLFKVVSKGGQPEVYLMGKKVFG